MKTVRDIVIGTAVVMIVLIAVGAITHSDIETDSKALYTNIASTDNTTLDEAYIENRKILIACAKKYRYKQVASKDVKSLSKEEMYCMVAYESNKMWKKELNIK